MASVGLDRFARRSCGAAAQCVDRRAMRQHLEVERSDVDGRRCRIDAKVRDGLVIITPVVVVIPHADPVHERVVVILAQQIS